MSDQDELLRQFTKERISAAEGGNRVEAVNLIRDYYEAKDLGIVRDPELEEYVNQGFKKIVIKGVSADSAFNLEKSNGRPKINKVSKKFCMACRAFYEIKKGQKRIVAFKIVAKEFNCSESAVEKAYDKHKELVQQVSGFSRDGRRAIHSYNKSVRK